jgi:hypothetical protein
MIAYKILFTVIIHIIYGMLNVLYFPIFMIPLDTQFRLHRIMRCCESLFFSKIVTNMDSPIHLFYIYTKNRTRCVSGPKRALTTGTEP